MIEEIQIYAEKTEKSTWIKLVIFKLSLIDHGLDYNLYKIDNVETVVLISRKEEIRLQGP